MVANRDLVETLSNWIIVATTTSPGSVIHILHPEDQTLGSSAMRNRVQTSDKAKRQSTDLPNTSTETTTAKSRRQVCCWKSCGKKFANQKDLSAHVNEDHVRFECPDVDFRCYWEGCPRQGRGFNARYKMLIHIRTHTNEKPHKCVVCDKSFSRLENLKIHTRSHTGERPYSCTFPGCSKAYSNSSDRFKHIRTHQEQKPYKCKMLGCQKQYTDPSSLRKHVRTHRHAPDSSRMELYHSGSISTQICGVKMEACSPSGDAAYDPQDITSSRVSELRKYIDTVRHLEEHDLSHGHFQTLHVIQNSSVDNYFTNSEQDNDNITKDVYKSAFSIKDTSSLDRCRDVLETEKLIWQYQRMNSQVDIEKSYLCSSDGDKKIRLIKYEPKSSTRSPVLPHFDTCNEQLLKKEYNNEEHKNDLTRAKDDLHKENEKSQIVFSTTESVSRLPIDDLTGINPALSRGLQNNGYDDQDTNISSCLLPPVLAQSCCAKFPKLEHWKKRKLLISEKESLASIKLSTSIPTSNQPQQYGTSPISVHSTSSSETSLQSLVPPHFSATSPNTPVSNSRSPLSHSHPSSSSHCLASPTPTCPQTTPKPAPVLSSPTPLSSPCETAAPNLYLLHYNHPLLQSLFTNSYTPISNSITSSSLYAHNSLSLAFSGNSLPPLPNASQYNSAVNYHCGVNWTHLLPPGSTFSHSNYHPPRVKHAWEHPGFSNLPHLMNVDNAPLQPAASCHHFTDSLRMMYQDIPQDLPSLYQNHEFRFPLYLGVNR